MDLGPAVVGVVDVRAGYPNVIADVWQLHFVYESVTGRADLFQRRRVDTDSLDHEIAVLFLEVLFCKKVFLARVEFEEHVLIAVLVGVAFLDNARNNFALLMDLEPLWVVDAVPKRSVALCGIISFGGTLFTLIVPVVLFGLISAFGPDILFQSRIIPPLRART